eukprot:jgi/Botrbrau1/9260/Bobra.180_1s0017.1
MSCVFASSESVDLEVGPHSRPVEIVTPDTSCLMPHVMHVPLSTRPIRGGSPRQPVENVHQTKVKSAACHVCTPGERTHVRWAAVPAS